MKNRTRKIEFVKCLLEVKTGRIGACDCREGKKAIVVIQVWSGGSFVSDDVIFFCTECGLRYKVQFGEASRGFDAAAGFRDK